MKKQNNEECVNLLSRLKVKLHTGKIAKKIAGLTIAGTILFTSVSCGNPDIFKPFETDTNTGTTGKYETDFSDTLSDSETEEYSEFLLNVLNNEHYNDLIRKAKNNPEVYKNGEFFSHPYDFLEDEGYDVEAIKSGELECATGYSYVKKDEPNNLYIAFRVITNVATPYFTDYIIKYELTDKEIEDYKMIYEGFYVQACFLNAEISKLKTPTIVSKCKITKEAHESLLVALSRDSTPKEYIKNDVGGITLLNFDEQAGTFEVLVKPVFSTSKTLHCGGKFHVLKLKNGAMFVKANSDGAFYKPCDTYHFKYADEQNEPFWVTIFKAHTHNIEKTYTFKYNQ